MPTLAELLARLEQAGEAPAGPPLASWQPPLSGDIDIRIAADGRWYHEGGEIRRQPLVRLFASILRREGPDHVLVTPVEKWRIRVDDLPFTAHAVTRLEHNGVPQLLFTLNTGEDLVAGRDHPLVVDEMADGSPQPRLHVRDDLWARVDRASFYQLAEWGEPRQGEGGDELCVSSGGAIFTLGRI